MKGYWVNVPRLKLNGNDGGDGVVRRIRFDDDGSVGTPVSEDWSGGKGLLEADEGGACLRRKNEGNSLPGQLGKGYGNIGLVENETAIKVGETQEGLNFLDGAWFRPLLDSADFIRRHGEAGRGQNVAQVFHGVAVELALLWFDEESMFPEAA